MAGIVNVNNIADINSQKLSSRLSFQVGEVFLARVIDLEQLTGDMILKLLDGWQFEAKLEKPSNFSPEGLIKFQVDGFEDGKLQLKIVNPEKKQEKTEKKSIEALIQDKNLNVSKDDIGLLEKMVKRNIPLTKENISNVKTLIDLGSKVNHEENFIENFTNKYIETKNIDALSPKVNEIKANLRGFFKSFSTLNADDILTFVENKLDFNEENIKSYSKLFKASNTLYKDIMQINKTIDSQIGKANNFNVKGSLEKGVMSGDTLGKNFEATINEKGIINILGQKSEEVPAFEKIIGKADSEPQQEEAINSTIKSEDKNLKAGLKVFDEVNNKEILKALNEVKSKEEPKLTEEVKSKEEPKLSGEFKSKEGQEVVIKDKDMQKIVNKLDLDNSSKLVKEAISNKTEEVKNVIKAILDSKAELKPDSYTKVMQVLEQKINDIKVFNSVSNQYYYMDLPVKTDNQEYQCKLLIKDERKKGKKIDSANVKIAASVNTTNMGTVDAYIKVSNKVMDVDIKCEDKWIKLISIGKTNIEQELEKLGYNVHVSVEEKTKEMTLPNSREFFEDNGIGSINMRV